MLWHYLNDPTNFILIGTFALAYTLLSDHMQIKFEWENILMVRTRYLYCLHTRRPTYMMLFALHSLCECALSTLKSM